MFTAYAMKENKVTQEMITKDLYCFYGCYLDGSIEDKNGGYDLFAMHKDVIDFIRNEYKDGKEIDVEVKFYNGFKMKAIFYYWNIQNLDRGLIATKGNSNAKKLFDERAKVI